MQALLSQVLEHWGLADAEVAPCGNGLINATYAVTDAAGVRTILQRVSPIFDPAIHHNIEAVTRQLARAGIDTPQLVPTRGDQAWLELDGGVWRMQTAIDGVSFDALGDAAQARAAGEFVGRWHAALAELDHEFVGLRVGVHDTPRHLGRLRDALARFESHRLYPQVEPLARRLLDAADALAPLPECPARVAHGDLKINNMMFAGANARGRLQPLALIDLDTVAPMPLAHELGDAWRSWCNLAGENQPEARFDLDLFAASWAGWLAGLATLGSPPSAAEREGLLLGPELISLELAVRFIADALFEDYFGWDPQRFAGRGEHNLARARGQASLYQAISATRRERATLLDLP
ncbi:phosphotransferase enzyme family protein [Enhygromyxa salina]|uniref:N-acetylhexosamine 1-kinase n=1 Tax=Enhygromyxa salina TaxID=215803 RepID=A0A2S9YDM1_9BACT|nr:aminoglycoside phosphotransferase family protein [Enhygromyxa salina]PRQ03132.1 N-acetylhexosamine 1-kinase [Enhygromyxa salina]